MKPPTRLAKNNFIGASERKRKRAAQVAQAARNGTARRSVLAQCDRCGCTGSGLTGATDRLSVVDIPAAPSTDGSWRHSGCGGQLAGFDTRAER